MGMLGFLKKKKEEPLPEAPEIPPALDTIGMPDSKWQPPQMDIPPAPQAAMAQPRASPRFEMPEPQMARPAPPQRRAAPEPPQEKFPLPPDLDNFSSMLDMGGNKASQTSYKDFEPKFDFQEEKTSPPGIASDLNNPVGEPAPPKSIDDDSMPEPEESEEVAPELKGDDSYEPLDSEAEFRPIEEIEPQDFSGVEDEAYRSEPPREPEGYSQPGFGEFKETAEPQDFPAHQYQETRYPEPKVQEPEDEPEEPQPKPAVQRPEPRQGYSRRIINNNMFINLEDFKEIVGMINSLSSETKAADETLLRVKDITLAKEKIYDKWQVDLEQVERELIQLDKILFKI